MRLSRAVEFLSLWQNYQLVRQKSTHQLVVVDGNIKIMNHEVCCHNANRYAVDLLYIQPTI